jgi:HNH endonuclease
MSRYIAETLRLAVKKRANLCCEYCLLHQDDFFFPFEIDHILSMRHGGLTVYVNLALSCSICNRNKAADIGTYLDGKRRFVRLFNPRIDVWANHFEINHGEIFPLTPIGRATVKLLDLNNPDRIILRQVLMTAGRYP